jgi:hypothetical protein
MIWIDILLFALFPTIIIEMAVLLFLRERRKKVLLGSIVMNILTNVPLNILVYYVIEDLLVLLMLEVVVIILEALGYAILIRQWKQAFIYSFLCNAISFLTGLLVYLLSC